MTAMVVLDANLPLDEPLGVDIGDFDMIKGSSSRLSMGVELPRREMLRLALMASENRAASALARHFPGGSDAFIAATNAKAASLGMTRSHFDDSTGLSPSNVSTARDLATLAALLMQDETFRATVGRTSASLHGQTFPATNDGFLTSYGGADGVAGHGAARSRRTTLGQADPFATFMPRCLRAAATRPRYPDRMDADRNGIPCETVYTAAEVRAYYQAQAKAAPKVAAKPVAPRPEPTPAAAVPTAPAAAVAAPPSAPTDTSPIRPTRSCSVSSGG